MLRRRLILFLGSLVVLLLLVAVGATWRLHRVVGQMDRLNETSLSFARDVDQVDSGIGDVEVTLREMQLSQDAHLDRLIDEVGAFEGRVDRLATYGRTITSGGQGHYESIRGQVPAFKQHIAAMATTLDPDLVRQHSQAAIDASARIRGQAHLLAEVAHQSVKAEQERLIGSVRRLMLGLCIVFLVVINVAMLVLGHVSAMVVRPVERLVQASRELAAENFDHRIELNEDDEFDELAHAFNALAAQLGANERRRMETLAQVAMAMNHELNNATSIIDLQLRLMGPSTRGNVAAEKCFARIRESLDRMTECVQLLTNIRRIVLTDYTLGVKMLDLRRSADVEDNPAADAASPPDWRGWP
ncbi:MAG: HAMP domain-containing protein [Phycisphaerae bacterium]|nr:HAMP domain-containing protein [Phycisphaerae bacterium]